MNACVELRPKVANSCFFHLCNSNLVLDFNWSSKLLIYCVHLALPEVYLSLKFIDFFMWFDAFVLLHIDSPVQLLLFCHVLSHTLRIHVDILFKLSFSYLHTIPCLFRLVFCLAKFFNRLFLLLHQLFKSASHLFLLLSRSLGVSGLYIKLFLQFRHRCLHSFVLACFCQLLHRLFKSIFQLVRHACIFFSLFHHVFRHISILLPLFHDIILLFRNFMSLLLKLLNFVLFIQKVFVQLW